jgi:ribosome modulation factor
VNESHDIRKHPIYTTQSAWDHYEKELAEQEVDKLHADHFEQQLDDSLSAVPQQTPIMDSDHELDEIARLAGLPKTVKVDTKTTYEKGGIPADLSKAPPHETPVFHESECNQTMEGQECPVHGLAECGMYEGAGEHDDLTGDPHEMGYRAAALYHKSKNSNPFEGVDEMKAMAWEDGWREGAAEGGLEEGNEFSGALAKARAQGAEEFEVDGETYPVREGKNKPDFADILKKAIDKRNAATVSTRKEIGSRVADIGPGGKEHNVRTDAAWDRAQTVKEDVNMSISANGEEDALNLIRKLAGMPVIAISAGSSEESCDACGASPCGCDDVMQEANGEHDWDNQPEEQYAPISASIPSGTDLHRSKDMVPHNYRGGDNPLAMKESAEDRLWRQYERMKTAVKK